jgi:putative redox protein
MRLAKSLCVRRRGTKEGKIDRIELDIEFAGPLSSEQRSKLLEIAKKCPVHRTLTSETNIRITAA